MIEPPEHLEVGRLVVRLLSRVFQLYLFVSYGPHSVILWWLLPIGPGAGALKVADLPVYICNHGPSCHQDRELNFCGLF